MASVAEGLDLQQRKGWVLGFVAFIYPYTLYHLFFIWNWATWYRRPFELSIFVVLFVFLGVEFLLAVLRERRRNDDRVRVGRVLVQVLFLTLPLLVALFHIGVMKDFWMIWFMSLLYHVYRGFLWVSYPVVLAIAVGSIVVSGLLYIVLRRGRIFLGLYLPWMLFLSPFFYNYLVMGASKSDISKYSYIEPVVHPLEKVGFSPKDSWALPLARGLYIEGDTFYTAYQADILFVYPKSTEESLFIYRADIDWLRTIELPGRGVRRMFSRPTDPYLYFVLWKWGYGLFRLKKSDPHNVERLIDLAPSDVHVSELRKLRQLSYVYVDSKGKFAYLLSELYPLLARFDLETKVLTALDLVQTGLCPIGSFLPDVPALDPDEKYMYIAPNHCTCGVLKIDTERMDVVGCYEVLNPNYALYGPVLYDDGQILCFPFSRDANTIALDAGDMQVAGEFDPPPFDGIREVVQLDQYGILCLSFFGHLALFDMRSGRYKVLIRRDLGITMGLERVGDYIYLNSSRHGILRMKIADVLKLVE